MLYYSLQEFSFFFQIWEPDIHFKNEKLVFNCLIVTNGIMWVLDRLMQVGILRLWEQTAILFCSQLAKTFRSIRSFTYKFTGLLIDIQILGYHKISWQRTEISPGFFSFFFFVSSSWKYLPSDKKFHHRSRASEWIKGVSSSI